jgi:uncharacterized protein
MRNPFWNREERRFRMVWRLLGQLLFLILALLPLQLLAGIVAGALLGPEGLPSEGLGDLGQAQIWLMQNPLWMTLASITTTLAMLASVWAAARLLDRRRLVDLGLRLNRQWGADLVFGMVLGAVLMTLIFVVQLLAGWVTIQDTFVAPDAANFATGMGLAIVIFVCIGFYEELFSRGYQLTNMAEGFSGLGHRGSTLPVWLATLLSAAVFGVLHLMNPNASWMGAINIMVVGVLTLGLGYILTGQLGISIGLHITWNLVQGNIYGFPVSGVDYRSATIFLIEQQGPELWTGGAFGPEAGLLGLLATLLGALLIVWWTRRSYGRAVVREEIALYEPLSPPPAPEADSTP